MTAQEKNSIDATARSIIRSNSPLRQGRQFLLWIAALFLGAVLGWLNIPALN